MLQRPWPGSSVRAPPLRILWAQAEAFGIGVFAPPMGGTSAKTTLMKASSFASASVAARWTAGSAAELAKSDRAFGVEASLRALEELSATTPLSVPPCPASWSNPAHEARKPSNSMTQLMLAIGL